jgi:uncharacterized MAPEG superfamily protein
MTVPFWCILTAAVLVYFTKMPAAVAMARLPGGYDNRHPRDQMAKVDGLGRRAAAAHANGFEGLIVFSASVFVAHLGQGNAQHAAYLAMGYVISRVGYVALYLADRDRARSLVWMVGMLCSLGLFLLPLFR